MGRKNLNLGFAIIFIALIAGHVAIGLWKVRSRAQIALAMAPTSQPEWQTSPMLPPQITRIQAGLLTPRVHSHDEFPWFGSTAGRAINSGDMRYAIFLPGRDSFAVHRKPFSEAPTLPHDFTRRMFRQQIINPPLDGPPAPGSQTGTSPFLPPTDRLFPRPPLDIPLSPNDTGSKQDNPSQ